MTMKHCSTKMDRKAYDFAIKEDGPGPAGYSIKTTVGRKNRLPNIPNEPAYTIQQPLIVKNDSESPGPVYNVARLTNRGKTEAPKYSIGMKLVELQDLDNPGPAIYKPRMSDKGLKPKILLPLKEMDTRVNNPGPNMYKLPSTLVRKGATLGKKIDFEPEDKSPGPAMYHMVPTNKYKNKAPHFSLAKRFEDPLIVNGINETKPGPQAYKPDTDYKYKRMPRFSFGIRHPDKFAPLIVCGDNVVKQR